jgi:hypothetical protein
MSLQNFGPTNLMLQKQSEDNKEARYQQNYNVQN